MSNLIKIDPKEFGLEETKAQDIANQFKPMLDKMVELEKEFNEVVKLDIENPETSKIAKELRLKYVKVRTGTAEIHKKQKEFYLAGGRFVDGWKNAQIFASKGKEETLEQIEKHFENLEKQRIQELENERINLISEFNVDGSMLNLGKMSIEVWQSYYSGVKQKFELEKAEAERIEKERLEKERLEAEEREKQRLENLKLKAEAEKREKEIEAERKERERIEAELKAEKEREAERLRQEQIELENKRKEAEKLAKAPIKKQLQNWIESFEIEIPDSLQENKTAIEIHSKFIGFTEWAKKEVNNF